MRDAQSPARVPSLDRLGPRLGSAFRPHEALTAQLLAATVASVNDWGEATAALVTGDLIDSAQRNELEWALALLRGGSAAGFGRRRLQRRAVRLQPGPARLPAAGGRAAPSRPAGSGAPSGHVAGASGARRPAPGNHDVLVQGEVAPSAAITAVATGDRLVLAPDVEVGRFAGRTSLSRQEVDALLRGGVPGDAVRVPADARRAHLSAARW